MICPRCSLKLVPGTLACARCGEKTPGPIGSSGSRPRQGRRSAPPLARTVRLDPERERGVTPLRVRPASPEWTRPAARPSPPPSSVERLAASSAVDRPRSEPPAEMPEEVEISLLEEMSFIDEPSAGVLLRRAAAALVDAGVVVAGVVLSWALGAAAFGWGALGPVFARGFDYVLDGLFLGRGLAVVSLPLAVALAFVYATLCHALPGATLGKHLFGLRVIGRDGGPPTFGESAARAICTGISILPAGAGLALALVDPRGLALHDKLVGTQVVRRSPPDPDA